MYKKFEALLGEYKGLLRTITNKSFTEEETWECGYAVGEEEMLIRIIMDIEDILSLTKRNN